MFDDFRSCNRRLQFFDNLMEQIIQKIGMRSELPDSEKSEAKELLKELIGELKKDSDFMSNKEIQDTLSEIDLYFYCPSIQNALSNITVSTRSAPGQKWVRAVYEAQAEIRSCMDKLYNYL